VGFPRSVTVEIDTREKRPLLFPETVTVWWTGKPTLITVATARVKLDAGDYRLREWPNACVIERKGSIEELSRNLLDPKDSPRQGRSFGRLAASSRFPYLLIHAAPSSLMLSTTGCPHPELLVQRLTECLGRFGLNLLVIGQTSTSAALRVTGTMMLHLMLGHGGWSTLQGTPTVPDPTQWR
jgi:hypothetical protein